MALSLKSSGLVLAYLLAVVAANWTVTTFGQVGLIVTGFLLIPFDLVTRDVLHEEWHDSWLRARMTALILGGSAISFLTSASSFRVALASAVAFGLAGLADFAVYYLMDDETRTVRMNASNTVSAALDSLLFPLIAFGGFSASVSLSQAALKIVGGLIWTFLFLRIWRDDADHQTF